MANELNNTIHIMIIDDQKTMRSIIRQLLQQSHFSHVTEASNGEEALKIMMGTGFEKPDVIICDLHMDKMDGMDFVNHMRRSKNKSLSEIPILILTGDKDDFLHDVTQQAGATKVLTKPIAAGDLRDEIESAIGFSITN